MKTKLKAISFMALFFAVLFSNEKVAGQLQRAPINMVWIPADTFIMGDALNEGDPDELPRHLVFINSFFIDRYEVTKALWDEVYQWALFRGYNFDNLGSAKALHHPVHSISWYDAVKWCNARSECEGKTPAYYLNEERTHVYRTGQFDVRSDWAQWNAGYRLPTEAEWEKAARDSLIRHRFPWRAEETITHDRANYKNRNGIPYDISPTTGFHPRYNDGVLPYTSPPGSFSPNNYGVYDMAGNLGEWCFDWYSASYYSLFPDSGGFINPPRPPINPITPNPLGPDEGFLRVKRGGSWFEGASQCRVADRESLEPSLKNDTVGFRSVFPAPFQIVSLPFLTVEEPLLPTYSCLIEKQIGKNSLVVITHGWIPKKNGQTEPPNPDWIDDMATAIREDIARRGINNWQIETYKWKEGAWMKTLDVIKDVVLKNGEKEGINLGNCISHDSWNHVHLIAHSAGAAVIQTASKKIKSIWPGTIIHTTFLDPYVGTKYSGKSKYGDGADWADNYFTSDLETYDNFFNRTAGNLDHAYNVEVTWLGPKEVIDVYSSSAFGEVQRCYQTITSHSWPHTFYQNTIPPLVQTDSQGFGFPLSKEGGNWDYALSRYSVGRNSLSTLGTPDPPCYINADSTVTYLNSLIDFHETPSLPSGSGAIENSGNNLLFRASYPLEFPQLQNGTPHPGTPAWLASAIVVTNPINFISFDAEFLGTNGGLGIFSIYWETNVLGTIDERAVFPGPERYSFSLPGKITDGTFTLGFRLDSFSNVVSSVTVTTVAFGFSGIVEPFSLSVVGVETNGLRLTLTGPSGFNYAVETSTDLVEWESIAVLVNTNGTVNFIDSGQTNALRRFYRAVGQ